MAFILPTDHTFPYTSHYGLQYPSSLHRNCSFFATGLDERADLPETWRMPYSWLRLPS